MKSKKDNLGEYAKGGPGRPKGCQNKLTIDLKMALMAPMAPMKENDRFSLTSNESFLKVFGGRLPV